MTRWPVCLALVAVLAVACGAPTPPSPASPAVVGSPAPVAACGLVANMAAAIGHEALASPDGYRIGGNDRCLWVFGRDPSRFIGLTVGPAANHTTTVEALGAGETVEGLGDDAVWWPNARTLSVSTGDRSFQVDLQLDAPDVTRDLAVRIALQVLAALARG